MGWHGNDLAPLEIGLCRARVRDQPLNACFAVLTGLYTRLVGLCSGHRPKAIVTARKIRREFLIS